MDEVRMNPDGLFVRPTSEASLQEPVTATANHFVVCHMGVPVIDADLWRVHVDGAVDRAAVYTLDDLRSLPVISRQVSLACAGNPNRPDRPVWRVGNAVWSGVSLKRLLHEAGLHSTAAFICLRGQDHGRYAGVYSPDYVKYVPVDKAMESDVVLAYQMNGDPLPPEHGYPLRAVVPGYYGTNSVKWLSRITLSSSPPEGRFSTDLYVDRDTFGAETPVWDVRVNSRIVHPSKGGRVPLGTNRVWGWAWGSAPISLVEISVNNGRTWSPAAVHPRIDDSWQKFIWDWHPDSPGKVRIIARATDENGNRQPLEPARNQVRRITVIVGDR